MIFIFGWGHKTTKYIGPLSGEDLKKDHIEGFFKLIKQTTWFTAFLIPVIPTKTNYLLSSEVDGQSSTISKVDYLKLKPLAMLNRLVSEDKIDEEEYNRKRSEIIL